MITGTRDGFWLVAGRATRDGELRMVGASKNKPLCKIGVAAGKTRILPPSLPMLWVGMRWPTNWQPCVKGMRYLRCAGQIAASITARPIRIMSQNMPM